METQDTVSVELLSREQADKLMRDLKESGGEVFRGFMISFDDERKRLIDADDIVGGPDEAVWALPAEERTYYQVKYGGQPYLLVGMSHHDTIASMAKITSSLSGKGAECLKALLEKELIHKCYAGVFYLQLSEDCDTHVYSLLQDLKQNLPEGVEKIYVFDNAASIICKKKTNIVWNEKSA